MLSARHLSAHSCLVASEKNKNLFWEVARSIVENSRSIGRLLGIVYSTIAKKRTWKTWYNQPKLDHEGRTQAYPRYPHFVLFYAQGLDARPLS